MIHLTRLGLYVMFRRPTEHRAALGFIIKPASQMLYSERYGHRRGFKLGPLYFRTYARKAA